MGVRNTYIIAEAGVNHNGSLSIAKKLVDNAKMAGADCIKFQTFKTELLVTADAPKAEYQKENTGSNESQFEMLKKLELSYEDFKELYNYCGEVGIDFLSTAFDLQSAEFLGALGMNRWKIPSGEITNRPLLEYIGSRKEKIILSTGMSDISEVEEAVKVLKEAGASDIALLHCTTQYPAPFESVNLRAIQTMRERFGLETGYSDHTTGIEAGIAAVTLGATILEKHFTLDRHMEGPDHKASLEPEAFSKLVKAVRNIEVALGDGRKEVQDVEKKNRKVARKSIVAARDISRGEVITSQMLEMRRPGTGISPMRINEVIGTTAIRDFKENELIEID